LLSKGAEEEFHLAQRVGPTRPSSGFRVGQVFDSRNLRKEWEAARKKAKFPTLLIHDLRRSGARNLVGAGVDEKTVMIIGGWKTRSVFMRYQIVSTKNIDDAMEKLEAASVSLLEVAEKTPKGQVKIFWSRRGDSNSRPSHYE
jgi:integrase